MKPSYWLVLFFLLWLVCPLVMAGPLHTAAKNNDLQQAEQLIARGISIEEMQEGLTPLFMAAQEGHLSMVQLLLKHKANPDVIAEKYSSWTPIILSAFHNRRGIVDTLLQHGANVNSLDADGYSAMAWAWDEGHLDVVKMLIKHGADLNAYPINGRRSGRTFLQFALNEKDVELAKLFAINGADFKRRGESGFIPLHLAVKGGIVEVVQLALDHGADTDINVSDKGYNKRTALHIAVKDQHFEIAKLLLKRGANANIQDVFGLTPLHRAARKGYTEVVRSLLKHGADVNVKGKTVTVRGYLAKGSFPGYTSLHAAVDGGVLEIVQMLVEHGADVNAKARGAIFTKEEIIRYSEKSPLDLALLYEKNVPGPRKAIVEFLSRYNQTLHGGDD